jgi:hypothetical protein
MPPLAFGMKRRGSMKEEKRLMTDYQVMGFFLDNDPAHTEYARNVFKS